MKKESVTLRIVLAAGLIILLLIPLFMIQSLIKERQVYRDEAIREISKSWAGPQIIAGPIITVVTKSSRTGKEVNKIETEKKRFFLPDNLSIEANVFPEKRYRGIYSAIVYKTDLLIKGSFNIEKIKENYEGIDLSESYLSFNINEPRGIQQDVVVKWDNAVQNVKPGLKDKNIFTNGFYSDIPINREKSDISFEITLSLNGVDDLSFVPMGKNTNVNVSSSWNSPGFVGNFLPAEREINDDGFIAVWNVNYFNRGFPQEWAQSNYEIFNDKFGVRFFIPADEYQQTMRSSKYGILILILTFASFFLVEIFSGKAIHPVQYMLIGLALILFYSLLLSLSEYILFQYSYLIAGVLVIGLIVLYTRSIYKKQSIVMLISTLLISFYGFIYVLLQLQDYSLLLGNIALFIILGAIMFFTRKVNWFDVLKNRAEINTR
jgi:inner membrane protein